MDALDGGELSGESGGNAILSPVSDSGSVSGQESLGVQEPAGQSVPVGEPSSAWLRENPGMGADENVLHGQRNHEGHRASGSHDSVTDKIAQAFQTDNPSADQSDGLKMQESSLTDQIDAVLNHTDNRYDNSIKPCDTPEIFVQIGLSHLPMLYAKKHLLDALKPKNPKKATSARINSFAN